VAVGRALARLGTHTAAELRRDRQARFRRIGALREASERAVSGDAARDAKAWHTELRRRRKSESQRREQLARAAEEAFSRGQPATADLVE